MGQAYVIDAVRTAVGKRGGALSGIHPVDLGAYAWRGLIDRVGVVPVLLFGAAVAIALAVVIDLDESAPPPPVPGLRPCCP